MDSLPFFGELNESGRGRIEGVPRQEKTVILRTPENESLAIAVFNDI